MDAPTATAFLPLALGYLALRGGDQQGADPQMALAVADKLAQAIVSNPPPRLPISLEVELEKIVPLSFAADLGGVSEDTLVREDQRRVAHGEASKIIDLSTRRRGMRIKHALRL